MLGDTHIISESVIDAKPRVRKEAMLITWVSGPLETPEREKNSFLPNGKCQKISRVKKNWIFVLLRRGERETNWSRKHANRFS